MQPTHRSLIIVAIPALLVSALFGAGCHKAAPPPAPVKKPSPPHISDADLAKYKPNEAGAMMVLMYHRLRDTEPSNELNRRPTDFRHDLEVLHKRGYYPVNASDIVDNKLDIPIGKTPVALTFDDSLPTQFKLITGKDGSPHIDPNCAVGILESFSKANSDWPTRATFFVLPKEGRNAEPFGQADSVSDKFDYLLKKGYEIANHTSTHSNMRGMSAATVQQELATARRDILQYAPKDEKTDIAFMRVFALPYGKVPRDKAAQAALLKGSSGGTDYQHAAVFLAGWRPIMAPTTKNDKKFTDGGQLCPWKPERLDRVVPDAKHASSPGTFEYWLKYFQDNPGSRYVSDGNPKVCAVPASRESSVDEVRVSDSGQILQPYGATSGKSGKSGGGLSVE